MDPNLSQIISFLCKIWSLGEIHSKRTDQMNVLLLISIVNLIASLLNVYNSNNLNTEKKLQIKSRVKYLIKIERVTAF